MTEPPQTTELIAALQEVLRQVAEPTHVLKTILEQAVARTGAQRGVFAEVVEDGAIEYRVLHGYAPGHFEGDSGRFSRSLFTRVLATGRDVQIDSIIDDPEFAQIESVRELRTGSVLCMTIGSAQRVAAIVHLEHRQDGHFTESHREQLRALLDVAAPVLAAARPRQWTKNLLLFAGLVFAAKLGDVGRWAEAIAIFLAYCAASSAAYLVNDVRDAEADRSHPSKRLRPVAAGALAPRRALTIAGAAAEDHPYPQLPELLRHEFSCIRPRFSGGRTP